jgi:Protein of unknown function (DUF3570)
MARLYALLALVMAVATPAFADDTGSSISDSAILGDHAPLFRVVSAGMQVAAFDQFGYGYQSKNGPPRGPGTERATILEPQAEFVATLGDRMIHRIWVPFDVVSSASALVHPDVVTAASRHVVSGTFDWMTKYRVNAVTDVSAQSGFHLEEPFRSFNAGFGVTRSFADQASVVSANVLDVFDWFDRFDIYGVRFGHVDRNGTTGSVGFTQVLTPTTVVNANYGITHLEGTLGNTWNVVPLAIGVRGPEILPIVRTRHAIVARAAQWLPWNGALHLYYRFYADDWGIVAHSLEAELMQRFTPEFYIGAYYRYHTQTGASFFTTSAAPDASLRTADSDLAPLDSDTVGGKIVLDLPMAGTVKSLHFALAVERYYRTNDLQMDIVSWATGFRF